MLRVYALPDESLYTVLPATLAGLFSVPVFTTTPARPSTPEILPVTFCSASVPVYPVATWSRSYDAIAESAGTSRPEDSMYIGGALPVAAANFISLLSCALPKLSVVLLPIEIS